MKKPGILLSICFFIGGFSSQILPGAKDLFKPPSDAGEEESAAEPRAVSPEPDESDLAEGLEQEEKELEGLARGGGKGKKVIVLEVSGVIDLGLAPYIKRHVENPGDAALIILDIDTPGGRVDAALQIRDSLLDSKVRTAAFIHPRAISAGALISYACDIIAISTGGSIGAATPISMGAGQAEAVEEKMMSYFRTEMAATARAKGRRGDLAEAMVDKDIEIEGITQAGKLLTLDTDNALRLKVADFQVESIEELLEETGLGGAELARPKTGWAEIVARWLTHPVVSGLLMTIGFLGILIELYTPGFGAPGIVGLSCLVLFFFGHLVVHLAGWEELVILLVGITLLGIELFVTPGFGVLGVLGLLLVVVSFAMALTALPITLSFETGLLRWAIIRTILSILAATGLFILAIKFLPRAKFAHPLVERAAISARTFSDNVEVRGPAAAPGQNGTALSPLRPSGRGRIGERTFDVIADGEFIDEGEPFEVVRLEGSKIIVRGKKT
jgi:membrane-bound serine protease (ClpP class)